MARRRCIQCDKELPISWADPSGANCDPVCPDCALRDLKKKSLRRRRILDTSVRKKTSLEPEARKSASQPQAQASAESKTQSLSKPQTSGRAHLPMDIELDTDDPLLLASRGESDMGEQEEAKREQEEEEEEEKRRATSVEETTQIRRPKPPPPGPQIKLNF